MRVMLVLVAIVISKNKFAMRGQIALTSSYPGRQKDRPRAKVIVFKP